MATTRVAGREQNPADDEFLDLLYRGGELLAAGKVIEAKDFLERAHKLQPKHEKGQNLLGLTYFKLGLFDRAAELYEMLVRDNPVDPTLRVNLGLVYLKTNALQRAVREFEVAVDLAPDHKKAHNYLGLALAQQSEYGRAREHFLLAGSDAMAEKMSRAIAGEGFSRPAPVQPAKARGFAELEGSEVVREQGGVPVAETPAPVSAEMVIDEVENAPVQSAAPVPPPPPPESLSEPPSLPEPPSPPQQAGSAEEDWGAQFGGDESTQQPAEAQETAEAPAPAVTPEVPSATGSEASAPSAELDFSGVGGPMEAAPHASTQAAEEASNSPEETAAGPAAQGPVAAAAAEPELPVLSIEEVSEDGMPVLTAEPENAEDLAAIAQHEQPPSSGTQVLTAAAGSAVEPPAAPAEEPPVVAAPVAEPAPPAPAVPPAAAIEEAWTVGSPTAISGGVSPIPSAPAAVPRPAGTGALREGVVPVLRELAPAVALGSASAESPFTVGAGGLCARVEGELLTRMEGLVAFTGQLAFTPEMKRFRGRTTDKPFGEGSMRVMRATGRGTLFIEPGEKITFQAVDLGDESAYFRDECVFAFEEPVMFENGRVPSGVAPDLDLVHLRGNGKVLLSLAGPLRSVPVTMEEAAAVPLTHLVGWQGNLTPRVVTLLQGAGGESLKTAVELSGEGFALICLPVR